jgi:hypothetical protein
VTCAQILKCAQIASIKAAELIALIQRQLKADADRPTRKVLNPFVVKPKTAPPAKPAAAAAASASTASASASASASTSPDSKAATAPSNLIQNDEDGDASDAEAEGEEEEEDVKMQSAAPAASASTASTSKPSASTAAAVASSDAKSSELFSVRRDLSLFCVTQTLADLAVLCGCARVRALANPRGPTTKTTKTTVKQCPAPPKRPKSSTLLPKRCRRNRPHKPL